MLRKAALMLSLALSLCFITLPFAADAQQTAKVYRIGWLSSGTGGPGPPLPGGYRDTFTRELHDLGYVEGQNLEIVLRFAQGNNERLPGLAAELVALKPDVIVAAATPASLAAKQATATIPIVIVHVSDPVSSGLVASLAHPGGNITGVSDLVSDLSAKYMELVHALVPKATRIGVLMSDNPVHPRQLKAIQDAATSLGLTVVPTMDRSPEELEQAFVTLAKEKAGAVILLGDSTQGGQAEKIAELAVKAKLPTISPDRWYVDKGGLLSIGSNNPAMYGMAAHYVDKILKGAKPGDLPVQQPTDVKLVINLKTAKALGLIIPQSLLLRANDVIK